jgi:hypothetical protein
MANFELTLCVFDSIFMLFCIINLKDIIILNSKLLSFFIIFYYHCIQNILPILKVWFFANTWLFVTNISYVILNPFNIIYYILKIFVISFFNHLGIFKSNYIKKSKKYIMIMI